MREATNSLLNLIDQAYLVGEREAEPESVFEYAAEYLDAPLTPEERAQQVEGIKRHAARIERLFGMTGAAPQGIVSALGQAVADTAHPTLSMDMRGHIDDINPAMVARCAQRPVWLSDLPFNRTGLDQIASAIRQGAVADLYLLHGSEDGRPTLALVEGRDAHFTLRLAEVRWTPERVAKFAKTFAIPPREQDVLAAALMGEGQAQIAERLDRSVETIRSQSKSLLLRTGVGRMTDLVLLAHSAALMGLPQPAPPIAPEKDVGTQFLPQPGGRNVAYRSFGPDNGLPFVFFHGLQLGPFLTPALLAGLHEIGIRLIAPSRPGFGKTSPVIKDADFDATVISDALAVIAAEAVERMVIVAHQGGTSHAFRTAAALGERVPGMLMISAGIPIDEQAHIAKMNPVTRMAALAMRRMPSVLEVLLRVGVHTYTRDDTGPRRYLDYFFRNDPVDLSALTRPDTFEAARDGALHMVAQGPRAFLQDAAAAMADWTADFQAVSCRQLWLHGAHCPVMNAAELERYIRKHTNHPIEISAHSGFHQFYDEPDIVLEGFRRAALWLE